MKQLMITMLIAIHFQCFAQQAQPVLVKAQPSISYNQPFAINIKGGGYMKYSYREWGVSLRWDRFPVYEWVIRSGNKTGPVDFSEPFQLYNTRVKRYLVYGHQNYGINLDWSNADPGNASSEWIFQGNALSKNPSGFITNKAGQNDHYIRYGERSWGINIVWSGKPSVQNIQLVADEVSPAELISEGGTWAFDNFNTGTLSWETFSDAFELAWDDEDAYNVMTPVIFFAARGKLAEKGNCFGMCLAQLLVAERNTTALPYFGRIQEPIWNQYAETPQLHKAINYFHWKQLSSEFLGPWLHGLNDSYSSIAVKIQNDLRNNNFGLLSIYKKFSDFEGHVVVPYKVEKKPSSNEYEIFIYDPNHPATSLQDASRKLLVKGNTMTYEGKAYDEVSYVPYKRSSGYQNLMNSLFDIGYVILGEGTEIEQISDGSGNNLYAYNAGFPTARTRSSNRLSSAITALPGLQGDPAGNTGFGSDTTIKDKMLMEFLERKLQQFGAGAKCYLVHDINLKNIRISVKSTGNKPVVIEAGNKDESVQISAEKKSNTPVSASVTLSQFKKPSASLVMAMEEEQLNKVTIEKTCKNKMKTGIEITNVEVPAKDKMISMSFGDNEAVSVKSPKQKQELTVNKMQLLRTGQKTSTAFKVQMQ